MLTIQQVRQIIHAGNQLRRHGQDELADELFVALVAKLDASPVRGVYLAYDSERPKLKFRTHRLMVRVGNDFLEMDRCRLAVAVFQAYAWPEETPSARTEWQDQQLNVPDLLRALDLWVPYGWLVPRDAPLEAWMRPDELEHERRRHG